MRNAVVFVGPSLGGKTPEGILDTRFLPPVKRGDIDQLLGEPVPPTHIGIIDGQFLQQMSISPKEILVAMDKGVQFYGSSSMGALRATELAPYGMIGVGRIYCLYQSGEVDADDEVAITFDAKTLCNLSEPMVNVRLAVADAVAAGALSTGAGSVIITAGKSLYFPQRTYPAILAAAGSGLANADRTAFEEFLCESQPDAKREDALEMLERMRNDLSGDRR